MQQQEYSNFNRGVLFRNERKESDRHPDYRGEINVDGKEMWLSAWIRKSQKGTVFMSLAVTPKEEVHERGIQQARAAVSAPARAPEPEPVNDFDDDIPF